MNDKKNDLSKETLKIRADLLHELIEEKANSLNSVSENLKKIDSYTLGSKESLEKLRTYVSFQTKEFMKLATKENFDPKVMSVVEIVLNNIQEHSRMVAKESENLYCVKQGEFLTIKQELDKIKALKKNHDSMISSQDLENAEEKLHALDEVQEEPKKEEPKRVRPDKNPKTRIGRAAMDLAERKRKYEKNRKKD